MKKILSILGFITLLTACKNEYEGPLYSIVPPFKTIPVVYSKFEFNAAEAKVIRLDNGSSIVVPENAFVDKNGKPVTGNVILNYREFQNASDIITSGIPMTCVDENGKEKNFESAGMFELKGTANGQEIAIAPDKRVNVNLSSKVEGDFDFYYLEDSENKTMANTSFFPEAKAQAEAAKQYRWRKIYSKTDSIEKEETTKKKKNPNAKYFETHFDTKTYPETAAIDTIRWEYAGRNKFEDPFDASKAWVQKEKWTRMAVTKPKFYSEVLQEINFKSESWGGRGTYKFLPDSMGFLAEDGSDYVTHYNWNGKVLARFKGATKINNWGLRNSDLFLNKQKTHLILSDEKGNDKLFLMNGTLVKNLGTAISASFIGKGDKIIYQKGGHDLEELITIASINGSEFLKIPMDGYKTWNVSKDGNYISLIRNNTLLILDLSGNTVNSIKVNEKSYSYFSNYNDHCIITDLNSGPIQIWDWKKNKQYTSESVTKPYSHSSSHPKEPLLLEQRIDGNYYLWNWEKGSTKLIVGKEDYLAFSKKGNFICNSTDGGFRISTSLIDKDGNKVIDGDAVRPYYFLLSNDERFLMLYRDSTTISLMDKKGKLIKDFKQYDSLIAFVLFDENGDVISTSKDGRVSTWDLQGKLLQSINTERKNTFAYNVMGSKDQFYIYNRDRLTEVWDFKTDKLLMDLDESYVCNGLWYDDDNYLTAINKQRNILTYNYSDGEPGRLWKNTGIPLESDVYKISLQKEKKDFYSYVRLTNEQLKLVKQYEKALEARFAKEENRVATENKLIRSFEISNFGVYNWDKFYGDTTMLQAKLSIDFDTLVNEFNHVTLFLITGKDRTVVIKYYKEVWDKFRFNATDNNQLIAVLPGDKIALFDEESFRKLDIEKIKKEGLMSVKMKIIEGKASKQLLNELLKKPS